MSEPRFNSVVWKRSSACRWRCKVCRIGLGGPYWTPDPVAAIRRHFYYVHGGSKP